MSSKAAYLQRGEAIDFTNETEATIEAGQIVEVGALIGVAGTEIPAHGTGSLHIEGVFEIPKKESEALKAGDVVCFNDDKVEKIADGKLPVGIVISESKAEEKTALVKINVGTSAKKA